MTGNESTAPVAEHPAIWLMRRIGRFLKWTVLIVVGLMVLGGGAIWAYNYWRFTLPLSQLKLDIHSDWQDKCADPAHPLMVTLVNDSSRTLDEVHWTFSARRPGHSTDLIDYPSGEGSSDTIIQPGKGFGQCWSVPKLTDTSVDWRSLQWSVKLEYATFE